MRKVVLTFGSIAGVIVSLFLVVGMTLLDKGVFTSDSSEVLGYSSMIVALSMVFFGIKSFRDNYLNGSIKFWKGVQVGLLISLVASLLYASTWEVYSDEEYRDAYMDKYLEQSVSKMKSEGASQAEVDQKIQELTSMKVLYRNLFVRFGFSLIEILPVGILITLISAAILRRREVLRET
jgi:hypothetical protein